MKKILALLGAISLTATSAMTVIACDNNKGKGGENNGSDEDDLIISNKIIKSEWKNDITKMVEKKDLGIIKIPASLTIPTIFELSDAINRVNNLRELFNGVIFEIKGQATDKKATIKATDDNIYYRGEIEFTYNIIPSEKVDLELSQKQLNVFVPLNPKDEDILKGIEEIKKSIFSDDNSSRIIISELNAEIIDKTTAKISVKADSKVYNQLEKPIIVNYEIDQRLDLNLVIKNKEQAITNPNFDDHINELINKAITSNNPELDVKEIFYSSFLYIDQRKVFIIVKSRENSKLYKNESAILLNLDIPQTFLQWEFRKIGSVYGSNFIPLKIEISKMESKENYTSLIWKKLQEMVDDVDFEHLEIDFSSIRGVDDDGIEEKSYMLHFSKKESSTKYVGDFIFTYEVKLV